MPQRLYAAQDANFNLTAITNTSGAVEERYVFDPYGTRTIMSASWSVISSSSHAWVIGHQGLMLDLESGLFYNRARMLHSMLGSFDRRDPFYYRSQLNLYDYVNGRPANRLDPTGMICCPPAKLAQESNDLAKCFAAVDAQMGKDLANALTAYNTSMASVNAVTASLLARCATSVSPKNLFYTEIVWGCQKGVQTAQGGVALGVFTAYETARAAILIANEKARNDCMHMYPCGVLNLGNPPSIS
jgi:RHS repeat-associated protein